MKAGGAVESRWVITDPELGIVSIPQAWATTVLDAAEPLSVPTIALVDLRSLLSLAKLVQTIQARHLEEKSDAIRERADSDPANSDQSASLGETAGWPTAAIEPAARTPALPTPDSPEAGNWPTDGRGGRE
jgi:hypothetical protein